MKITVEGSEEGITRLIAWLKDGPKEMAGITLTIERPMVKEKAVFEPGTVVLWTHKNFNPEHWNGMSEEERIKYHGWAGYGAPEYGTFRQKAFVFICPINDADGTDSGHCVLLDMKTGKMEWMRHTVELRAATEEEF